MCVARELRMALRPKLFVLDEVPVIDGAVIRVRSALTGFLAAAARISGVAYIHVRDPAAKSLAAKIVGAAGIEVRDVTHVHPAEVARMIRGTGDRIVYVVRRGLGGSIELYKLEIGWEP